MAIALEFISVLVRNSVINSQFPGGCDSYRQFVSNGSYYRDLHLTRAGFMKSSDAYEFVTLSRGHVIQLPDIAVVSMDTDPATCCDWLVVGKVQSTLACWLRGTDPSELLYWRSPSTYICPMTLFDSLQHRLGAIDASCSSLPAAVTLKDFAQFQIRRDDATLIVDAIFVDSAVGVGLLISSDFGRVAGAPDPKRLLSDLENLLLESGATKRE